MRTRVCITIDTEFSIGGAFSNAARTPVAEPLVWCEVGGQSQGLGFMLDTFGRYGVQATFFVETLQRNYFKHDPMRAIARQIHDQGHEVQLHSHPCWTMFQRDDWREVASKGRPKDNYHSRDIDDSAALIQQGIDTFADWGLPRPQVFRSGNMHHDDALYQALAKAGIPYASNVAVAIFDCGDAKYRLYSGQHERHGVREFPVLTFADWALGSKQHIKSLTIAGSSFAETRRLLEQARAAGIPLVVILTHPFEYVQNRDLAFSQTRTNSQTQRRLVQLCAFLHENRDRFDGCGLATAANAIPATSSVSASASASAGNILLKGALRHTVPRMAAQVAYHKYGRWLLSRKHGPYTRPT